MLKKTSQPGSQGVDGGALQGALARLIVEALNLDIAPADIDPIAPLYGEGLGLDSIDVLEVALVVARHYGVELRADSQENERIFASLANLAHYVAAHRTR